MKYIIVFLLTAALLCFSIVTGPAERPTELPSGTYYLSLTSEDWKGELKNVPVQLTTKIEASASYFDKTDIVIEENVANHQIALFGKFVGHTHELYSEGKMIDGTILLSMTKFMDGAVNNIKTWHLIGKVSNHSAKGEGTIFENDRKAAQFKWTLTNQRQD